jgi:hypothetical protein
MPQVHPELAYYPPPYLTNWAAEGIYFAAFVIFVAAQKKNVATSDAIAAKLIVEAFSTSNTPKATAGKCFKRFVSLDLKELSQRNSTRLTAQVRREPGSKSKIRILPLQRASLRALSDQASKNESRPRC